MRKLNNVVKKSSTEGGSNTALKVLKNVRVKESYRYDTERSVRDSSERLNDYIKRISNNEYMTADEISGYRKALSDYKDSSSRLRSINYIQGGSTTKEQRDQEAK